MADWRHLCGQGAKALAVASCLLLTSGCASSIIDDTSREIARSAVNEMVAVQFPGVDASGYTDCIIDNASTDELLRIARDAATKNTGAVTEIVLEIAKRPETATCLQLQLVGGLFG